MGEESQKSTGERVKLTYDETEEDFDASQSMSFGEKVRAIEQGGGAANKEQFNTQESIEDIGLQFSSRLATKNPDDIPVLERAKIINKTKFL